MLLLQSDVAGMVGTDEARQLQSVVLSLLNVCWELLSAIAGLSCYAKRKIALNQTMKYVRITSVVLAATSWGLSQLWCAGQWLCSRQVDK